MKKSLLILCVTVLGILLANCSKDEDTIWDLGKYELLKPVNPLDKGDRIFGINISESKLGFDASYNKATEAGIQVIELNIPWNKIETEPGKYVNPDMLFTAVDFYGNNNIKVGLSLAVINTVKWEMPDYLKDVSVNSVQFINAFNNMVDWVMDTISENVTIPYISVGNEVDLVLSTDKEWEDYTAFYKKAAEHIQTKHSTVKVGVKTTVMGGLFGSEKTKIQLINQHSDVIMLNYYPQDEQFKVLAPDIVLEHFGKVVTLFPNEKIWFTEIGYQSGHEYCASTETKQAHFFHNMFTAWDTYKDQVKVVVVDWLHDQSPELIEEWKSYYGNDPALVDYLSTLGLRNHDGTDKAAWLQLQEEVASRGWK